MTGTVRRAGDGAPLRGVRIQIWAHTTEGHERDHRSHGATLTDAEWVCGTPFVLRAVARLVDIRKRM